MVKRRLAISSHLWAGMLTNSKPQTFRVTKNRLPEDMHVVDMTVDRYLGTIYLWIESSVFQESDPIDLPSPIFELVHSEALR